MNFVDNRAVRAMRRNGLALDANLAIVLIVGLADRRRVGSHRRTSNFSPEDYDVIFGLCQQAKRMHTTPHILTEVSDLLDFDKGQNVAEMRRFVTHCHDAIEVWREASLLSKMPGFDRIGLADAALFRLAEEGCAIATADFPLASRLQSMKLPVINFNHVRPHLAAGKIRA